MSHFASQQPANRARCHQRLALLTFDINNVENFITEVHAIITRMHEVGIVLPTDLVGYNLVAKLPLSMSNLYQHITHSGRPMSVDLVLEHLQTFADDRRLVITAAPVQSTS
ncbi:hypothetical protein PSTG_18239 [Puccinia striiformis f. sp. tritici PST-78]|uniref:Uncharacterized protein n=1 Tax=Puccinia striiformis f. sp. tritici PST-78 TaxID=1165861 RepID=A0A0L0UN09_9BASI|nr:hypothetical protein PSTG_18239 [Puccinia striiformis f. sp. tritici PST-78]